MEVKVNKSTIKSASDGKKISKGLVKCKLKSSIPTITEIKRKRDEKLKEETED